MSNKVTTLDELIILLDNNDIKHESNGENSIVFHCDNHMNYLVRCSDQNYSKIFTRLKNIINEWIAEINHGRS